MINLNLMVERTSFKLASSLDTRPISARFPNQALQDITRKTNSKFNAVKSKVDHGRKERKASDLTEDATQVVTKLRGELFSRLSPDALAKFLMDGQVHITRSNSFLVSEEIMRQGRFLDPLPPSESECPKILLLDLREQSEYRKWHIRYAINFPAVNIQQDSVFGQLAQFKNKTNKLIVVYANDERHGTQAAKIIFEKGYDNIYLLTGSICVFAYENHDLLEGTEIPSKKELKQQHEIATVK